MTSAQWVIGLLGVTALLAWLGTWIEVVLLQVFNHPYFARGPVLLEKSAAVGGADARCDLKVWKPDLPEFEARSVSSTTMLVRRRLALGPLRLAISPPWSARMELEVERNGGGRRMYLRVRHGLCWPAFVMVPTLGAICALVLNPSWALFVLFLACAALGATPILASIRLAKRDGGRFWDAATRPFTQWG